MLLVTSSDVYLPFDARYKCFDNEFTGAFSETVYLPYFYTEFYENMWVSDVTANYKQLLSIDLGSSKIPYSLKFSRLKFFAVFADYGRTTKILSLENFTYMRAQYDLWAGHLPVPARSTAIDRVPRAC